MEQSFYVIKKCFHDKFWYLAKHGGWTENSDYAKMYKEARNADKRAETIPGAIVTLLIIEG